MLALAGAKLAAFAAVAGLSGLAISGQFAEPPRELELVKVEFTDAAVLSVARYEVRWSQWKQCYDAGGCAFLPRPGSRQILSSDRRQPSQCRGIHRLAEREIGQDLPPADRG